MTADNTDPTPFAIGSQTLVPLSVAYSRDDIRRRNEAFETDVHPVPRVEDERSHPPSPSDIAERTEPETIRTAVSPLGFPSGTSTFGPVYSCSQRERLLFADEENDGPSHLDDTVMAVYEEYGALSLHELGYAVAEGSARESAYKTPENFLDMGDTSWRC